MYSDISILTIFRSVSNNCSANDLATSVLPTPVGPKNRKLPIGRFSSLIPALDLKIASLTFQLLHLDRLPVPLTQYLTLIIFHVQIPLIYSLEFLSSEQLLR